MALARGNSRTQAADARERVLGDGILIVAHRGDSKVAPENTLPAFESALLAGADMVELDVQQSADGQLIVIHDAILDRSTNALALWGGEKIRVDAKTRDELQGLDAGAWFGPKFAGARLPSLADALATIQPRAITVIERKSGSAAAYVELLRTLGQLDRVVVQAFDWQFLAECHALAPQLVLGALGEKELTPERLDAISRTGALFVGWSNRDTTPTTIEAIHSHGWKAWVWTVDEPKRARELAAAGIDALITNCPAQTRAILR